MKDKERQEIAIIEAVQRYFGSVAGKGGYEEFLKVWDGVSCSNCREFGKDCKGEGHAGIVEIIEKCLSKKDFGIRLAHRSRKRRDFVTMFFNDAKQAFQEIGKELDEDREVVSMFLDDNGRGYCLHCNKRINLEKMPVQIQVYKKTGQPVAEQDAVQYPLIVTLCQTKGCDGTILDWSEKAWWRTAGIAITHL